MLKVLLRYDRGEVGESNTGGVVPGFPDGGATFPGAGCSPLLAPPLCRFLQNL